MSREPLLSDDAKHMLSGIGGLQGAYALGVRAPKAMQAAVSQAQEGLGHAAENSEHFARAAQGPHMGVGSAHFDQGMEAAAQRLGLAQEHAKFGPLAKALALPLGAYGAYQLGSGLKSHYFDQGAEKAAAVLGIEKIALRGDPFLNQWKQVFHTGMGPSAAELAVVRGKNALDAARGRMGARAAEALKQHAPGSAEHYVLQAGWDPHVVNGPQFGQKLHVALGDLAPRAAAPATPPAAALPALAKAASMQLQFDSTEAAAAHQKRRMLGGALGGLAGGFVGGAAAGKRFGVPGSLVGGALGAMAGAAPGHLAADVLYDIPHRTASGYEDTMRRMTQAGGDNFRFASADVEATQDDLTQSDLTPADAFTSFAKEDAEGRGNTGTSDDEMFSAADLMRHNYERSPGWGNPSALEGLDGGTRNMQAGLPTDTAV